MIKMIGSSRGMPPMLAFLFELAWASRIRLPILIAAAFMVTNIHMRLEININFEMEEQIVMQAEDVAESNTSDEDDHEEEEEEEEESECEVGMATNCCEEQESSCSSEGALGSITERDNKTSKCILNEAVAVEDSGKINELYKETEAKVSF